MSGTLEEKPPIQAISSRANGDLQRLTKTRNMATDQKAIYKMDASEGSERKSRKRIEHQETEIRDHVFAIRLSGVEITHCNFTKTQVEVWYVADKTESDKFEEELQKEIGSNVEPYKLKLVKRSGIPTFRYTSPGESTILGKSDGCIGAYVTLTDTISRKPDLHALVSGHGKEPGNPLYSNQDPGQKIGVVKVAKEGESHRNNSYDVGLVYMDDQQRDHHETSVTMNGKRIQLATTSAALSPDEMADGQKVMLFNNDNQQGTVLYRNYNSRTPSKFGMIAIAEKPGDERKAVHGMNESGTLVVALSPYQERDRKPVKSVGMLVGIEEFTQPIESISLAVPIGRNLQELMIDSYCENKVISFE